MQKEIFGRGLRYFGVLIPEWSNHQGILVSVPRYVHDVIGSSAVKALGDTVVPLDDGDFVIT